MKKFYALALLLALGTFAVMGCEKKAETAPEAAPADAAPADAPADAAPAE